MSQLVDIAKIRIDGGTQPRVKIDDDLVNDYIEHIDELPPVHVMHDGTATGYWLFDGFHRYHAHLRSKRTQIKVVFSHGTQRDAILASLKANSTHGKRRTNEDKRHAVEICLLDTQWSKRGDREIGRMCAVSHTLVVQMRAKATGRVSSSEMTNDGPPPEPENEQKMESAASAGGTPRIFTDKKGEERVIDVAKINEAKKAKAEESQPDVAGYIGDDGKFVPFPAETIDAAEEDLARERQEKSDADLERPYPDAIKLLNDKTAKIRSLIGEIKKDFQYDESTKRFHLKGLYGATYSGVVTPLLASIRAIADARPTEFAPGNPGYVWEGIAKARKAMKKSA